MEPTKADVLIIGAGACGLNAAYELSKAGKKVIILEALNRPGGRIYTIYDQNFDHPVEMGGEFIHGRLENTLDLLKKAGIPYHKVSGSFWQKKKNLLKEQEDFIEDFDLLNRRFKEVKVDIPVSSFIEQYLSDPGLEDLRFTLKNYVEGYYAGELGKVSTKALEQELNNSSDVQYRIYKGYISIINYLIEEIKKAGGIIYYDNPVQTVQWKANSISILTSSGHFIGTKLLVTIPVGLWIVNAIKFEPEIPEKHKIASQLGYGPVIKTLFQFKEKFWGNKKVTEGNDLSDMSFVFSEATIPTWWTQYPEESAMITGWSGGPHALELIALSDEQIMDKGLESLAEIFNTNKQFLSPILKSWKVANWPKYPYSLGAYSFQVVNGSQLINVMKEPVDNTIFIAGEGLIDSPEIGTVEAALTSGRETAEVLLSSMIGADNK